MDKLVRPALSEIQQNIVDGVTKTYDRLISARLGFLIGYSFLIVIAILLIWGPLVSYISEEVGLSYIIPHL
ncbi:MAG: hypothetical protein P4M11_11160 [Candidatus Pacebacteria bacterium]|nr:hypothetical protein [Candidatus Paceibacterota bacterium]